MAKWDIKDGFWCLDCAEGGEWNFAYVLPQDEGQPVKLVIPTSLQMGGIESPPYFCAASETASDVAIDYIETPVGLLPRHKFIGYAATNKDFEELPVQGTRGRFPYMVELYIDDCMAITIATSQEQLKHVATGVMMGVYDISQRIRRTRKIRYC